MTILPPKNELAKRPKKTGQHAAPGFIEADCLYTQSEVQARLKLGDAAIRSARKNGLKVGKIGSRNYILGKDLLDHFEASSK